METLSPGRKCKQNPWGPGLLGGKRWLTVFVQLHCEKWLSKRKKITAKALPLTALSLSGQAYLLTQVLLMLVLWNSCGSLRRRGLVCYMGTGTSSGTPAEPLAHTTDHNLLVWFPLTQCHVSIKFCHFQRSLPSHTTALPFTTAGAEWDPAQEQD